MTRTLFTLIAALALFAAACSSDSGSDTTVPPDTTTTSVAETTTTSTDVPETTSTTEAVDDGFPVTVEAPNGSVTIEARPQNIVSLSPTSTEVLFAIGAGDQVTAVDSLSNYPASAPTTDLSAFTPNLEAIVAYDPDLVFISFDPNGDLIPGLETLGIPVILHGTAFTVSDAFSQWEQTGAATGHIAEVAALVAETQADLDGLAAEVPESAADMTYYYELDNTLYSATSSTFIGELLSPTTITNIADDNDPDGWGYPQLSAEVIIGADPTMILLADTKCCGQTAETVAERPGWDVMSAVAQGNIVELDDDIASRWGPRIVELVEDVVKAILQVELQNA